MPAATDCLAAFWQMTMSFLRFSRELLRRELMTNSARMLQKAQKLVEKPAKMNITSMITGISRCQFCLVSSQAAGRFSLEMPLRPFFLASKSTANHKAT